MKKETLGLLIILVILLVPTHSFARKKMKIIVHMIDQQYEYFSKEVIPQFEKENRVKIDVVRVAHIDNIEAAFTESKRRVSLLKIPFGKCWSLANKGHIMPLNTFLTETDIKIFEDDYILTWFGQKQGKQYFLPRKYETRVMVYRKSKVEDVLNIWSQYRNEINMKLKELNGYGLPRNYILEEDPSEWDFFDIFVVGMVWSLRAYNGEKKARIGHRGAKYLGTALRIVDRVFQCKGDLNSMLYLKHNSVVDAFQWEATYAYAGIYHPAMWEQQWKGENLWNGFYSEDVFLSFMTQLDCMFLHGTGRDDLSGFVQDPEDLGVALMPTGCSLEIHEDGAPLRSGTKSITTGGWLWAIPKKCPFPLLAYKLFLFITSKNKQLEECRRFGMIPVRRDILKDKSILYEYGWTSTMFRKSYKQIQHNGNNFVSSHDRFSEIVALYLDAWYDIVVGKNWAPAKEEEESPTTEAPSRDHIENILWKNYSTKAVKIIGR